jgi:hypothetical protein
MILYDSAGLGSSLHSLRANPTENTASNTSSIDVMGGCLAMATYIPSRCRCIATALYATVQILPCVGSDIRRLPTSVDLAQLRTETRVQSLKCCFK